MPPKKRKFESTFPAARIKKIMQLDNDVGRVASSVPVVISRAVEIFLNALLTRAAEYASSRSAKTLTVGHLKHSIEQEKQWDFLKELTAKISDVTADQEEEEASAPKRGRKRRGSPSQSKPQGTKRRHVKNKVAEQEVDNGREEEESDSEEESQLAAGSTNLPHTSTTTTRVPGTAPVIPHSSLLMGMPQADLGERTTSAASTAMPSISQLTSGLQHSADRQQGSDDDYDE